MKTYKSSIIETLNSYKCKNQSDELKLIPIHNEMDLIGFLRPVTFNYKLITPEYISLFSKWRKENPIGFASHFEVTNKRTEFWLDNILLTREDRILFVIYSLIGDPIGHLGFSSFNFENKSCEIDNVVRGIKTKHSGIMSLALMTLIKWGKNRLKQDNIYLRVLSDNLHAISFYERNSFHIQWEIPLYKIQDKDETKWVETKNSEGDTPDRFYTYMKLIETKQF